MNGAVSGLAEVYVPSVGVNGSVRVWEGTLVYLFQCSTFFELSLAWYEGYEIASNASLASAKHEVQLFIIELVVKTRDVHLITLCFHIVNCYLHCEEQPFHD